MGHYGCSSKEKVMLPTRLQAASPGCSGYRPRTAGAAERHGGVGA